MLDLDFETMLYAKYVKKRKEKVRRRCAERRKKIGDIIVIRESRLLRPFVRLVSSLFDTLTPR
jgi:ribosomal protein S17